MLTFHSVSRDTMPLLRSYYENCTYRLCEYSALIKIMWSEHLRPQYAEAAGCLIVLNDIDGKICFDYPVPGSEGDIEQALSEMEAYCVEKEIPLSISVVPSQQAHTLLTRYPRFHLTNLRSWRDYLYEAEAMRNFLGKKYSGQRNHINKFQKLYPTAQFRILGPQDSVLIDRFLADYEREFSKTAPKAIQDLQHTKEMLHLTEQPWFKMGGMELDGRLLSVCVAEQCGDMLIIHIEKALYSYEGVYPMTVREFARAFAGEGSGIQWLNREDDADDPGLRTSKLQYLPAQMVEKYCFDVKNELYPLTEIPEIRTKRLVLNALTEADRATYTALCLDEERNRWWGYDYRTDWQGEPLEDYFLSVAQTDFAAHRTVNFAVRLDGKCIGEVILYRFDGRGGAELGCRIASEYTGNGYGVEAFAAVAEWGLYRLQLAHVTAKCYRENAASYRMLSSCMRRVGEDDVFYYFNKEV